MGRHHQSRQARRAAQRKGQHSRKPTGGGTRPWSILGGAAVVIAAIAIFAFFALRGSPSSSAAGSSQSTPVIPNGPSVGNIKCDQGMTASNYFHIHAHLTILNHGKPETISPDFGHYYAYDCLYWVHAHSDANGIIHMESPTAIHPTLAQWYQIARNTLPKNEVPQIMPKSGEQEKVYVDQKPYTGNPMKIRLYEHTTVTIELGGPFARPQPFNFGQYNL